MVKFEEGSRTSVTGETLYTVTFTPDTVPIGTILFHHGLGEHVGRHRRVLETFASRGFKVFSYDAYGHGRSTGIRAYFDVSKLVDDFSALVRETAPGAVGGKVFLTGVSLGGLVSLGTALRDQTPVAGLAVVSAALFIRLTPVMKAQNLLSPILNALTPKARLVPAVRPEDLSRNPEEIAKYLADPLNTTGNVRVASGVSTAKHMDAYRKRWGEVTVPLLGLHGDADRCTDPQGTRDLIAAAASADKRLVVATGAYHEIFNEEGGDVYLRLLADWFVQRAPGTAAAPGAVSNPGAAAGASTRL